MTRILLVDDHQIIRDGLRGMIEEQEGYKVVAEASNGDQALDIIKERTDEIDLVILDINMPVMDGIECAKAISEKEYDVKILALTMLKEDQHIREMLEAGVQGYILKKSGEDELMKAIDQIMKGKHYFSEEATEVVLKQFMNKGKGDSTKGGGAMELTEREIEVLSLIADEYTNQEIADELFISVRTVDAHRRNLMEKIGAKNTAGLVKYAIQKGHVRE